MSEVLIVGFGPVGAALAGLLGLRGIDVTVLDREHDVFPLPRAAHVDHTGLRTWQELGVLDALLPRMRMNAGLDFVTAAGELLIRIPGNQPSVSGLPASMYFYQPLVDRTVREAVSAMPTVKVVLDTEVTGVTIDKDHVTVDAIGPDRAASCFRSSWVVGCDGAGSAVRKALGLSLIDLGFEEPWLVLDLVLSGRTGDPSEPAVCWCDPRRPTYSIPMPEGRHRFELRLMGGETPEQMLEPERIHALLAQHMSTGDVKIERSAVYTFHGLVAREWRKGRVLLAGDAAHQMPPFLGQGMCSGLRDAANLAWKLERVMRGRAPIELLDTYGEERREHVRSVVEAAVAFGRIICVVDPDEAAKRDRRFLGDPAPPTGRMVFTLPTLKSGPLVLERGGELFLQPAAPAGDRLDDLVGQRFAVIVRDRAVLGEAGAWWDDLVGAFISSIEELPASAREPVRRWLDVRGTDAVIVRPDRHVMWTGTDLSKATEAVAEALRDA